MKYTITSYLHEIILFFILLLFILVKIPALHLPYFWDELGVYSKAALYLHDKGLGVLPKNLPPDLSRGHPLLFPFINALAFKIFGDSVVVGHTTSLFFSLALIIAVYFTGKKLFSKTTGLVASILLILQPLFIAQSVLVLPEIMLALCIICALYFFISGKMLWYCVFASAGVMIKETAVLLPFLIIFAKSIEIIFIERRWKKFFEIKNCFVFFPLLVFTAFLLIQKKQNGWYLFPLHTAGISSDVTTIKTQLTDMCYFLFVAQGRIALSILLIGAFALQQVILFYRRIYFLILVFVCVFILIYTLYLLFHLNYADFPVYFFISFAFLFLVFISCGVKRKELIYFLPVIFFGVLFCSVNLYMNRYALFMLPPLVLTAAYYFSMQKGILKYLPVFLIPVCFYYTSKNLSSGIFTYDEDMSYAKYVTLQKNAVQYMESISTDSTKIFANFPLFPSMLDRRQGYIKNDTVQNTLILGTNHPTKFDYIFIADPGNYSYTLPAADSIHLDTIIRNEFVQFKIYSASYQ